MWWMGCLANFGPLHSDLICLKPYQGKSINSGGVLCPLGGLIGAPGVTAGVLGLLGRG